MAVWLLFEAQHAAMVSLEQRAGRNCSPIALRLLLCQLPACMVVTNWATQPERQGSRRKRRQRHSLDAFRATGCLVCCNVACLDGVRPRSTDGCIHPEHSEGNEVELNSSQEPGPAATSGVLLFKSGISMKPIPWLHLTRFGAPRYLQPDAITTK